MIKKIDLIKDYGVFKDFKWKNDSSLQEFKEKNIIYGWNYSGKTTLSRIFTSMMSKSHNDDFRDGRFKIEMHDGSVITESDYSKLSTIVQVFNSDYIAKNLKWEDENGIDPIQFDVGGGVEFRAELKTINEDAKIVEKKLETIESDIKIVKDFENTYTKESKRIKLDVFNSLIEFDKGNMKTIAASISNELQAHLLNNYDYQKNHDVSLETNDKITLTKIFIETNQDCKQKLLSLHTKTKNILVKEPSISEVIQVLAENPKAHKWANDGISIHKELQQGNCLFCGNNISPEQLLKLNNYFSNEGSQLKNDIDILKKSIVESKQYIENFAIPKSKNDLTTKCQQRFTAEVNKIRKLEPSIANYLNKLTAELERKEKDLFSLISITHIDTSFIVKIEESLEEIDSLIEEHNNLIDGFVEAQKSARQSTKEHLVARYLIDNDYTGKVKIQSEATKKKKDLVALEIKLSQEASGIEAKLKDIIAGKNELNTFIQKVLNRNDIVIGVSDTDRFVLKRGNKLAKNLSEGEKTAISFSHFLVSLESLARKSKLQDAIIFIDDPISSLDSNHIAHIYSLINSFFFRKGLDKEKPEKVINCFKQLFISTHNFDFFSFLQSSNRIKKNSEKNPLSKCEYYFMKRISNVSSTLINCVLSVATRDLIDFF